MIFHSDTAVSKPPRRSCRDVRGAKVSSIVHVCDPPEVFILRHEIVLTMKATVTLCAYLTTKVTRNARGRINWLLMIMLRQLVIINENPARFFLILILISGILPNSVQSEIRQLILENNAHMQCHTRVKSSCIGSINSSFLFKSADCLNKIGAQKQSLWLLLLWDYGKPFLYQVFISSTSKVVSANATALHAIRAVISASLSFDDWMPAFLLSVD